MPLPERRPTEWAECATCPDCERVLVLGHMPPESKRPFVLERARGERGASAECAQAQREGEAAQRCGALGKTERGASAVAARAQREGEAVSPANVAEPLVTGWVLICRTCGCEFPVRSSEIVHMPVEVPQVH
jgi:hypothetical protein